MRTRAQALIEHNEAVGGPQGVIKKVRLRITRSASRNAEPIQQASELKLVLEANASTDEAVEEENRGPRRSSRIISVKRRQSEDQEDFDSKRRCTRSQSRSRGRSCDAESNGRSETRESGVTVVRSRRVKTRSICEISTSAKRRRILKDDISGADDTSAKSSSEEDAESSEEEAASFSTEASDHNPSEPSVSSEGPSDTEDTTCQDDSERATQTCPDVKPAVATPLLIPTTFQAKRSPLPVPSSLPTAVRSPLPVFTAVRSPLPSAVRTPLPPVSSQILTTTVHTELSSFDVHENGDLWSDAFGCFGEEDADQFAEGAWPDIDGPESEMHEVKRKGARAIYRCSRCLAPKKGHKCPMESENPMNQMQSVSASKKRPTDTQPNEPFPKKILKGAEDKPVSAQRTKSLDCNPREFALSSKWLLDTGVLEGQNVRYVLKTGEVLGDGVVKNSTVFCSCKQCKGVQCFNVTSFEKHVGSIARHPSENIFLDNGRCLREVLEAGSRFKRMPDVLKALRSAVALEDTCAKCLQGGDSFVRCSKEGCFNMYHEGCASDTIDSAKGWCQECVRADNSSKSREVALHQSLFLGGALADGTVLGYYSKGQHYVSGVKQGGGIRCSCCTQTFTCSQFEVHAGWGSRRDPYNSIYLQDGRSLHEVAMSLPAHGSCCLKCGRGGELVFCRGCSEAYHEDCAEGLKSESSWLCSRCQNGRDGQKLMQVKAEETTLCGCSLCRIPDFEKSGFGPMTMLICDQCEREFHVGCLKEHGLADLQELPEGEWFCGKDCQNIHKLLNLLLFTEETVPKSLAASVLERCEWETDSQDVTWQLLHGKKAIPNGNEALLSEALAILASGFAPIVDPISGQNLLSLMVHSRSIRDQEFGGMYCIVLKHRGLVVSAASLRVFGRSLAEMPLVATRKESQGKGYFQTLFGCIELLLGLLNVEQISLPAADGAEGIWLNKFGFSYMPKPELQKFREEVQLMFFAGSSVLKKAITALPGFPLANQC